MTTAPIDAPTGEADWSDGKLAATFCELSQSLAAESNTMDHLRQLKKFLLENGVERLLHDSAVNHSTSPWIQTLCSVPDLVANSVRLGDVPDFFQPRLYYRLLAQQLTTALSSNHVTPDLHDNATQLLTKLLRLGAAEHIAEVTIPLVSPRHMPAALPAVVKKLDLVLVDKLTHQLLSAALRSRPPLSASGTAQLLLDVLPAPKDGLAVDLIKFVLIEQALLNRVYRAPDTLKGIALYYHLCDRAWSTRLQFAAAQSLLLSWSESTFLRDRTLDQQTYVTCAMLCCLGFLSTCEIPRSELEPLSSMGLRAVNNFLASTLPSSRKIGMAAAECLAQFFQPDAKLDFELEAGDELVAACRQSYRAAGDLLKRSDGGPIERSMQAMALQAPQESRAQADSDDDDDEQDDDLTPYAMPHELPVDDLTDVGRAKRSNRKPVYVGQCIELLKGAEDVENVDAVLTHIVEVVERASDLVLEECAQDLCRRLLYLENRFTLSFFSQRLLALVQLYMRLPRTIGPYLGEQFYARSCSVGQRIDILQAICAACLRLHPVHLKQTANLAPLQSAYDSISDETARSKTRWYSAKMRAGKEKPLPERNKLSGVAGWFFYPYLAPWENAIQKPNATSSEAGVAALVRSLQSEHCLVLEKLIIALSTVVYHAAHTPEHGQLAHDLWLFGWSLRHHTDRKVQTAVLFGFTCIFETVDEAAIKRDMPDYAFLLGDWIAETLKQDGNEKDAIAFMAFLMARLQTILSQELQLSLS